jgi:hypothetical protein
VDDREAQRMIGMFHKWAFKASLKKEIEWKVGKERMKYWERRINRPEYEMLWEHIYHLNKSEL